MALISIGDMAQAFQMRRHHVELHRHLTRLTEEMTSGTHADMAAAVSGDFRTLAGIDRSLTTLAAFKSANSEAALFAETLQTALETAGDIGSGLAPGLLTAAMSASSQLVDTATNDARQKFHTAVSALNTQVADRFLLSGTATDQRPISGSRDILDALMTAIAGQVTASGVETAVEAWFDGPAGSGGYVDTVFGGAPVPLAPFGIGPGEDTSIDVTATDPALRSLLKGLALAALVAEGALAGDATGRALLTRRSGERLIAAGDEMAALRARVGTAEAAIDDAAVRNAADVSALEIARSAIVSTDPYETATALEAVRSQVETLYTLTARLSRLSFTDYMR